jgi:hypothetical protein
VEGGRLANDGDIHIGIESSEASTTRSYNGNETGRSVLELKVAVWPMMETSITPRLRERKNLKYSVNHAWGAAVNYNINYEVDNLFK